MRRKTHLLSFLPQKTSLRNENFSLFDKSYYSYYPTLLMRNRGLIWHFGKLGKIFHPSRYMGLFEGAFHRGFFPHSPLAVGYRDRLRSIEGNLSELAKMNLQDLQKAGLSEKKAMKIMAGVELGKRIAGYTEQEKPLIHGPCDAAHLLQKYLKYSLQEIFVAMSVNTKNRVIKIDVITKGILDASLVHPREVFRAAIENNASSLILAHSHPSSEITPSTQDIEITKTLVNAGKVMGIEILDHIIIGHGGKFLSMKGKRLM